MIEKQITVNTIEIANAFDKLLEIYELHKALRVSARVNRFIRNCHHCVIYTAMPFPRPKPGTLPKQRIREYHLFQVIGVDYVGPIYYRSKNKAISKSYILLFSCIQSYPSRIYIKSYYPRVYQEYEKANSKTGES